jgi:CDP-paratose synthetase
VIRPNDAPSPVMQILITGATGFLGSALAFKMAHIGHAVTLLVRPQSSLHRLHPYLDLFQLCTIQTKDCIKEILKSQKPDVVIHAACSYDDSHNNMSHVLASNFCFGFEILEGIKESTIRSRCVFVNAGTGLPEFTNFYAFTKRQFSRFGQFIAHRYPEKLQFIDLQLETFFGFEPEPTRFTSKILHDCCANKNNFELTSGQQQRDFIHVSDVVAAFETVLSERTRIAGYESIPVGSGESRSVRVFAETVKEMSGSSTKLIFGAVPDRPFEAMQCIADCSRLLDLGWKLRASFEERVASVIEELKTK